MKDDGPSVRMNLLPLDPPAPEALDRALNIATHVLAGMAHAHGQGIVHRDIKPGNVMLDMVAGMGEQVHIFDFGLAKLLDGPTKDRLSITAGVMGTPGYMSPEQASAEPVDHRSDLYSAGIVIFEMLTGRRPFDSDDPGEVIRMHKQAAPPALHEVDPDVPYSPELEAVLVKSLAKTPEDRFQSAARFAAALRAVPEAATSGALDPEIFDPIDDQSVTRPIRQSEIEIARDGDPTDRPARPTTNRALVLGVGGVLIAALTIGILLLALDKPADEPDPAAGATAPDVTTPSPDDPALGDGLADLPRVRTLIEQGNRDEAIAMLQLMR